MSQVFALGCCKTKTSYTGKSWMQIFFPPGFNRLNSTAAINNEQFRIRHTIVTDAQTQKQPVLRIRIRDQVLLLPPGSWIWDGKNPDPGSRG